jgi:hypothetical protein
MRAISYRGELVAVTTKSRVYLAPRVSELSRGDRLLRFVAALCLYSRDVDGGAVPVPYNQPDAEFYARSLLVADDEFERFAHETDVELAARFGLPQEQIAAKRRDVAAWRRQSGGAKFARSTPLPVEARNSRDEEEAL